jgi:signal transduction histidine kinase
VQDDGVGIPADATPGGGTANLRNRAEGLGGSVDVSPNEPRGTVVRWTVPISS